jgi:hypothetical protein
MASFGERMVGAMKADVSTFEEIERDTNAMTQAVMVIVIAGVASLLGNIFRAGATHAVWNLTITVIAYAAWALIVTLIGTKLLPEPNTRADFNESFRVLAFAASPGVFYVLAMLPFLGPVISLAIDLWSLVLMIIAVRTVLDYTSTGRAIVVCLVGFVIYWILKLVILVPLLLTRAMIWY